MTITASEMARRAHAKRQADPERYKREQTEAGRKGGRAYAGKSAKEKSAIRRRAWLTRRAKAALRA